MEYAANGMRQELKFTRVNPVTNKIEYRNLKQHLTDLGIYEEPKANRKLTPELITYFAELKARIDNLK